MPSKERKHLNACTLNLCICFGMLFAYVPKCTFIRLEEIQDSVRYMYLPCYAGLL